MMETDLRSRLGKTREEISQAGREVWLASLGAVSLLEKEGRTVFERLVEKGKTFETREKSVIEGMINEATGQVRAIGKQVEDRLQDTSKAVLQRFGVPSHAEINALIARVEQLTAKVESISRKEAADDHEG
ncbi:MAG: phasin family protein [Bacteroidales bacterium]